MTDQPSWVVLKTFSTVHEAEIDAGLLRSAGIPARVDVGDSIGVFGPGYQGSVTGGVRLLVPAAVEAQAHAVVDDSSDNN